MSSPVLQSILQGHYVPDFIYRSTDGSVYFTRPSRTSGSTLYGHDQLTNLPIYGLSYEVPIGGSTQRIAHGVYAGSFGSTAGNLESDPQPTHQPEFVSLKRSIASRNLLRDSQRQARGGSRDREPAIMDRITFRDSQRQARAQSRDLDPGWPGRISFQLPSDSAGSYPDLPSGDRGHTPGHQERSSSFSAKIGGTPTFEFQDRSNVIRAGSYRHSERSCASDSRRKTDSTFPIERVTFGDRRRDTDFTSPIDAVTFGDSRREITFPFGSKIPANDWNSTTREPTHASDERHGPGSTAETGHRFDNFDDTFIHAVINAQGPRSYCAPDVYLDIGRETRKDSSNFWSIGIPYLELPQEVVRVYLPLDQTSLLDLTNDVLRVLHVHIADPDRSGLAITFFTAADVAESRRLVLRELERRGFTEQMPHVVRLRGLRHRPSSFIPNPTSSSKLSTRPGASTIQSSKGNQKDSAGKASQCQDCCHHKSHQQFGEDAESSPVEFTGKASEKKKGKAPVDKGYEANSSNHSDGTTPSGVTPTEDSTSEDPLDILVYGKGKASASRPDDGAKKAQAYIDRLKAVL
jgi:hypothetical protein